MAMNTNTVPTRVCMRKIKQKEQLERKKEKKWDQEETRGLRKHKNQKDTPSRKKFTTQKQKVIKGREGAQTKANRQEIVESAKSRTRKGGKAENKSLENWHERLFFGGKNCAVNPVESRPREVSECSQHVPCWGRRGRRVGKTKDLKRKHEFVRKWDHSHSKSWRGHQMLRGCIGEDRTKSKWANTEQSCHL